MRARNSRAAASATGRVPARSPSATSAGRDVVETARRDADDPDAEALQALGDAGRRAGLPDDGDRRPERDDALVVEPEGVADLRQPRRGLGIIAERAHRHDLVRGAGGEQHLGQVRRDAHDALPCGRRLARGAGGERKRDQPRNRLQASTSRRNAAPRSRTAFSSRCQSKAGPGSVLRPGAMSLCPAIQPSASDG